MSVQQDPVQKRPAGVLHDSELPVEKKPSVLFVASTAIGVLTILALAAGSYYGLIRF